MNPRRVSNHHFLSAIWSFFFDHLNIVFGYRTRHIYIVHLEQGNRTGRRLAGSYETSANRALWQKKRRLRCNRRKADITAHCTRTCIFTSQPKKSRCHPLLYTFAARQTHRCLQSLPLSSWSCVDPTGQLRPSVTASFSLLHLRSSTTLRRACGVSATVDRVEKNGWNAYCCRATLSCSKPVVMMLSPQAPYERRRRVRGEELEACGWRLSAEQIHLCPEAKLPRVLRWDVCEGSLVEPLSRVTIPLLVKTLRTEHWKHLGSPRYIRQCSSTTQK